MQHSCAFFNPNKPCCFVVPGGPQQFIIDGPNNPQWILPAIDLHL